MAGIQPGDLQGRKSPLLATVLIYLTTLGAK